MYTRPRGKRTFVPETPVYRTHQERKRPRHNNTQLLVVVIVMALVFLLVVLITCRQ
jgi:hypothetical protein